MASKFDINGENYEDRLLMELEAKLTDVDKSCDENLDRAIWEKVEEDMSGYISMMTTNLFLRIKARTLLLNNEIHDMTEPFGMEDK